MFTRTRFPALIDDGYMYLVRVLIGSLDYLRLLWLARAILSGFGFTTLNYPTCTKSGVTKIMIDMCGFTAAAPTTLKSCLEVACWDTKNYTLNI